MGKRVVVGVVAAVVVVAAAMAFLLLRSAGSPAPAHMSAGEVKAVVAAFDPGRLDAVGELNRVAWQAGPDAVPALAPFIGDPDPNRRFAALYVVARVARAQTDLDVLATALTDPVPAYRVIAAGSLAGKGEVRSLGVLVDALDPGGPTLPYSDPPRPAADLAREALEAYTGEKFPDATSWKGWWGSVKDHVRWDGKRYVVR